MGVIRALLVGVSDYDPVEYGSLLPLPSNVDIKFLSRAICDGLCANPSNIVLLGENRIVTQRQFIDGLRSICEKVDMDDTFILYFSCHSVIHNKRHLFCFSDCQVSSQAVIDIFAQLKAKNKIVLMDTCMSGHYTLSTANPLTDLSYLDDFLAHGCAVLASCDANQISGLVPGKPLSLFTYFLGKALMSPYTIYNGKKSLDDIKNYVLLLSESWNEQNPLKMQTPIFRCNVGGTIMFDMNNYHPYKSEEYHSETDDYIVCNVEPMHIGAVKRYSCNVILKKPALKRDVAVISRRILHEIANVEVYASKMSEMRHYGRKVNVAFLYFGYDDTDIANSNFAYRSIWADESQDRNGWYKQGKDSEVIDDICVIVLNEYNMMKRFTLEHTGNEAELRTATNAIVSRMITLAEQVISQFHEYQNGSFLETELIRRLTPLIQEINALYLETTELDIPPVSLHSWFQTCSDIAATIHDFYIYYSDRGIHTRTAENRKQCMNMTIKRYHRQLFKLQEAEKELSHE